ncbi:pyridoxamine 5'-phosphate oxidase family protein [Thermobispora bispora]|uniref:Pyridoxamine 5'-phosphate oxidase-related FMN-binding protein n=1 Tax=Thermobispora bispora (strain ATCC 19993 / DSM 43833 / CBS 139.67 / JCM 10125 / KCTC 9307 / NBRC 14880 / R51) TaxID=469371 RepID=D6Y3V3_THEBD|nr:pyridoxamine 5'-phosphate oxidase-related FMN- binding protein [Thermobispora bispora DSM 43833]
MTAEPRSRAQRRRDTEHRLNHDVDVWVATASPDGLPYLVPLSFDWDGETLLLATPAHSPTGRNLAATRTVRLGLGHTRDVTVIDGDVEVLEMDALPKERGDRFAARTGFDPRAGHAVPLVPRHAAPDPGLARGERADRPGADARRPLAGLNRAAARPGPGTPGSGRARLRQERNSAGHRG